MSKTSIYRVRWYKESTAYLTRGFSQIHLTITMTNLLSGPKSLASPIGAQGPPQAQAGPWDNKENVIVGQFQLKPAQSVRHSLLLDLTFLTNGGLRTPGTHETERVALSVASLFNDDGLLVSLRVPKQQCINELVDVWVANGCRMACRGPRPRENQRLLLVVDVCGGFLVLLLTSLRHLLCSLPLLHFSRLLSIGFTSTNQGYQVLEQTMLRTRT